jgi:hypothetical protein
MRACTCEIVHLRAACRQDAYHKRKNGGTA